jgi:hypothetical protein
VEPRKHAASLADFTSASHFAINVLAADQHHLSRQFSTRSWTSLAVWTAVKALPACQHERRHRPLPVPQRQAVRRRRPPDFIKQV